MAHKPPGKPLGNFLKMLPKAYRIQSSRLISLLFKKGKVYKNQPFLIRYLPSLHPTPQFALLISKKVSPLAVQRNRLKRQISEILRLHLPQIQAPMVALITLKPSSPPPSYAALKKGILDFMGYYQFSPHVHPPRP